jgi:hypothetical protein
MHLSSLDCLPHVLPFSLFLLWSIERDSVTDTRTFSLWQSPPFLILIHNLKWPLPSTSLPVHYSPFILSFDRYYSSCALSNAHSDGPYCSSVRSVVSPWEPVNKFWQNVLPTLRHLRQSQIDVWVCIDCSLSTDIQ